MSFGFRLQAANVGPWLLGAWLRALSLGVLTVAMMTGVVTAAQGGLYAAAQAERGQVVYDDRCASCHGGLRDITPGMAALLADRSFRNSWTGRPLGELFGMILETMPQDDPGTLSSNETADLVAYILSGNRFPSGDGDLPPDLDTLMEIPFER